MYIYESLIILMNFRFKKSKIFVANYKERITDTKHKSFPFHYLIVIFAMAHFYLLSYSITWVYKTVKV